MNTTTVPVRTAAPAPMSVFERYLTVWVALCIAAGIALGQLLPGPFQAIGRMEAAKVNLPVGALSWVMMSSESVRFLGHPRETKPTLGALEELVIKNKKRKYAQGDKKTDFFRVVCWRQLGEICAKFLSKGKKIAVVGELQARTYEAKDGTTRMSLDVQADEVEFLSPKQHDEPKEEVDASGFESVSAEDIPF